MQMKSEGNKFPAMVFSTTNKRQVSEHSETLTLSPVSTLPNYYHAGMTTLAKSESLRKVIEWLKVIFIILPYDWAMLFSLETKTSCHLKKNLFSQYKSFLPIYIMKCIMTAVS